MIKRFCKDIVLLFIELMAFIYPYKLNLLISNYIRDFYSKWLIYQMPYVSRKAILGRRSFVIGNNFISIGERSIIGDNAVLTAWDSYKPTGQKFCPQIIIGNDVNIGEYCHITAINRIVIEDGVLTGRRITITDNSHGVFIEKELMEKPIERALYSKGEVVIGRNVWIGDKVTILPGVHIGEGTIIAANTVVTKDIPAFSVCAGNPGKIIKKIE